MTTSEVESSSKVLATHRYRSAVVYVRQSTPGQVEHNTESTDRQYALAERAVRLGWPRDAVRIIDADLGSQRREHRGSFRVRRADHPGRAGSGGNRAGPGGFPARPEQLRLVPAAGPGRDDEHAARRRRRRLPSGVVQRPDAAGLEGNNVGSRTARAAGPAGRRDTEQGPTRGTAPRPAGRAGLGRGRGPDPAAPGRGRHRGHRRGVRQVRRLRVGPRDLAVAAGTAPEMAAATRRRCDIACPAGDLGGTHLPRGAHHAHPPGVRRRLRLRPHPRREVRHR